MYIFIVFCHNPSQYFTVLLTQFYCTYTVFSTFSHNNKQFYLKQIGKVHIQYIKRQ